MKTNSVIMVRIYLTESEKVAKTIVKYLKEEAKVRGVSIFRAISGFGDSGEHTSSWVTLSLNLPITIEFFGHEAIIQPALEYLSTLVNPEHIVFWNANTNELPEIS